MQDHSLIDAVGRLSRAATDRFAVEDLLRTLCETAADTLDVDGAGVLVRDGTTQRVVHATTDVVRPLEDLQELLQVGPCFDGVEAAAPLVVDDIRRDGSRPAYQHLADRLGVGATVTVPLLSRGRGWGTLDLYRRRPGPWDEDLVRVAAVLADVAVSYVVMAHDRGQVELAREELAHRAVHDDLTGLADRALLLDRLDSAPGT